MARKPDAEQDHARNRVPPVAAEQQVMVMDIRAEQDIEKPDTGSPDFAASAAGRVGFDISNIDRFPGPAFVVAADGRLVRANVHAEFLILALKDGTSCLPALLQRCLASHAPTQQKIILQDASGSHHLDIQALPIILDSHDDAGAGVLLFARETTLEQNLTNALVESRQMFKDLLTCSADFAWETDPQGVFRYVSPRGAFGYPAHELTGRAATDFLADAQDGSEAERHAFSTRTRIDNRTIRIRRNDGSRAIIHLAAAPIVNARGEWLGTRGICRDVSLAHHQNLAYEQLQARYQLVTNLAALYRDAANDATNDAHVMNASAATIAAALSPRRPALCWILRRQGDRLLVDGTNAPGDKAAPPGPVIRNLERDMRQGHYRCGAILTDIGGQPAILLSTRYRGVVNGALLVTLMPEAGQPEGTAAQEFDDDQLTLVEEAGEQISLTIEHARIQSTIAELTVNDELTGLLNRQAFEAFTARRIAHQRRTGGESALLLIEIDDFSGLQDRLGRLTGDSILRQLGGFLRDRSRVGDAIARVGSNRFALWLEDTPTEGAVHKARHIIRNCGEVTAGRCTGTTPVSVCIGIAAAQPRLHTTLDAFKDAAARALEDAKQQGRGQYVLGAMNTVVA